MLTGPVDGGAGARACGRLDADVWGRGPAKDVNGVDFVFSMTMDGMLRQWPLHEMLANHQRPSREIAHGVTDPFHVAVNPQRITLLMVLSATSCSVRCPPPQIG